MAEMTTSPQRTLKRKVLGSPHQPLPIKTELYLPCKTTRFGPPPLTKHSESLGETIFVPAQPNTSKVKVLPTSTLYSFKELEDEVASRARDHTIEICDEPEHAKLMEMLMAEVSLLSRKLSEARGVNAELAGRWAWVEEQARRVVGEIEAERRQDRKEGSDGGMGDGNSEECQIESNGGGQGRARSQVSGRLEELLRVISRQNVE